MSNEEKCEHISFDFPNYSRELDPPDWLENERTDFDFQYIVTSDTSPHDSKSSASFDGSTAIPTSASDAVGSSPITTSSSDTSPHDSKSKSSTSNEPVETFLHFGRKMTAKQFENLSNNPKQREQFKKSADIYREMTENQSSMWFFASIERRKQCRKVTIPEVDDESIQVYEPIVTHMRSQHLFEDNLVLEHFKDPIYVMFVNWYFVVRGLIQIPPLLLGNTDLSLADFICIFRLTYSVTKLKHYLEHHTFAEVMKLVMSIASTTDAKISNIVADSDSLAKDGGFASLVTDKLLENDPGLKELFDLYFSLVEEFQKYALPITVRIIKKMIGEKRVKYFMIEAQSSNYLKYCSNCCEQVTEFYMHSFKNGIADMKKIETYHLSTQNNRLQGVPDGLLTLGLYHRALYLLLSVLSIIHNRDFDEIFENGMFDFQKLLKDAGVAGVKGGKLAIVSKDTKMFCRLVGSDTIESFSLQRFVHEKGISYEEFYTPYANASTYKHDVQEVRDYDVSLNRTSLEVSNTYRGVSEKKTGKFRCDFKIHQRKKIYLGTHPSPVNAAYVHDRAVILSGICDVTLNFGSQEKLDVAIGTELIRTQESMSEEELVQFDPGSFIAKYKESIPSDAVIKGVLEENLSWTKSLEKYSENKNKRKEEGTESQDQPVSLNQVQLWDMNMLMHQQMNSIAMQPIPVPHHNVAMDSNIPKVQIQFPTEVIDHPESEESTTTTTTTPEEVGHGDIAATKNGALDDLPPPILESNSTNLNLLGQQNNPLIQDYVPQSFILSSNHGQFRTNVEQINGSEAIGAQDQPVSLNQVQLWDMNMLMHQQMNSIAMQPIPVPHHNVAMDSNIPKVQIQFPTEVIDHPSFDVTLGPTNSFVPIVESVSQVVETPHTKY